MFDDEEPLSPHDPDSPSYATSNAQTPAAAHLDPDAQVPTANGRQTPGPTGNGADGRGVVEVNGAGGEADPARKIMGTREKKIAEQDRSTTPYMTKYERARVLGTRALQIRSVPRSLCIRSQPA